MFASSKLPRGVCTRLEMAVFNGSATAQLNKYAYHGGL